MHGVVSEIFASVANLEEHRVGQRLAREGCTSSTEGHRDAMLMGNGQNFLNLLFIVNLQHQFGVQAVERCISPISKSANGVGELPALGNELCLKKGRKEGGI